MAKNDIEKSDNKKVQKEDKMRGHKMKGKKDKEPMPEVSDKENSPNAGKDKKFKGSSGKSTKYDSKSKKFEKLDKAFGKPNKGLEKGNKSLRADFNVKKVKKRTGKKDKRSLAYYIHKLLRIPRPEATTKYSLSQKGMAVMDSMANDIFDRICSEAVHLTKSKKQKTLTTREVQTAIRLLLAPDLCQHAIGEGNKAVANFQEYRDKH